jgi:hypothetical protein
MRYDARLSVTLRLILLSLVPALSRGCSPLILTDSYHSVSSDELLFCLCAPDFQTGFTTGRSLTVPGALAPAAPFVLFRLKRWGYSGCRVSADQNGLRIEVRR